MLQSWRVAGERTPLVGFNIHIYTLVTKHVAWSGEGSVIGAHFSAERADFDVCEWRLLAVKVERWRRGRKGGQGLNGALVLGWIPPLQKLQEKHSHRKAGWKRYSHTANCCRGQTLTFLNKATNQETFVMIKHLYIFVNLEKCLYIKCHNVIRKILLILSSSWNFLLGLG